MWPMVNLRHSKALLITRSSRIFIWFDNQSGHQSCHTSDPQSLAPNKFQLDDSIGKHSFDWVLAGFGDVNGLGVAFLATSSFTTSQNTA